MRKRRVPGGEKWTHGLQMIYICILALKDIEQYKDVGRTRWDPYKNEPITNAAGLCYIWRKIVNTDESRQLALLEIVEKHPRAIIFYNFDYELELLKELFIPHADTMYFEIAEWNGHKHQPIPKSESWVYLVQYNAGNIVARLYSA